MKILLPKASDVREFHKVQQALDFLQTMSVDQYDQLTDQIFKYQPFLLSFFMGYLVEGGFNGVQQDKLTRMMCCIWLYYRSNPVYQKKKLTEKLFEQHLLNNARFLKYWEAEPDSSKDKMVDDQIDNFKGRTLFAHLTKELLGPSFHKVKEDQKKQMYLAFKAMIDALESLNT